MHQINTYCMDDIDIYDDHTGKSKQQSSTSSSSSLSGQNKWRSQRAEELKKNPNQKRSYSSKPIHRSDRDRNNDNNYNIDRNKRSQNIQSSQQKEIIESPTTYKDSRFTRFAQEQQELEQRNSNHPIITNTNSNTPSNRIYYKVHEQ